MKFNIKDFLINALIAFVPVAIIWTILEEIGINAFNIGVLLSSLIKIGIFFGFVKLSGKLREFLKVKIKKL